MLIDSGLGSIARASAGEANRHRAEKRPRRVRAHLAPAAALALAVAALLPRPGLAGLRPQGVEGFSDEIAVAWVLVPAVVRDRDGYVFDLAKRDFRLRVDGRPVAFESFEAGADAPLSLVFLQDLSGSMAGGGKFDASRDALARLLDAARTRDELALATFAGGRLRVDVPFTEDLAVVAEAMADWDPYGTTALHDAVAWIPEISVDGRHLKRAVVLVTDGIDNASHLAPETARQIVRESRLPVYVLGLGGLGRGDEAGRAAVGTYAELLRELARTTGGRYYAVADAREVAEAVTAILAELRAQYVLGFSASGREKTFHRLEVEVPGRRKVEVLHRTGYTGGLPGVPPPAP